MGKLSDLFAQVRRVRSSKGIGFVGKSGPTLKARAMALLVELHSADAGKAEASVKAGADGLVFTWDGSHTGNNEALHKAIEAAQAVGEHALYGLHLSGGWEKLERHDLEQLRELGVSFLILPLNAPARLLGIHVKDLETVVSVPMREGDSYPIFIRNLSAFEKIAAIHLDFHLTGNVNALSIEDVVHYRAVREAIHAPALVQADSVPAENDAYALLSLGIQAIILEEGKDATTTEQQVSTLRDILEKVHQDEKEASTLGLHSRT